MKITKSKYFLYHTYFSLAKQTHKCRIYFIESNQNVWFDAREFKKIPVQRVYQYLNVYDNSPAAVNNFNFNANEVEENYIDCLEILLRYVLFVLSYFCMCNCVYNKFMHFLTTQNNKKDHIRLLNILSILFI